MKKLEKRVNQIGDWLDKMIYVFGGTSLLLSILVYSVNIWDWWLFSKRIPVADDIALLALVWTSFVGMGLLQRQKGHCTMDFLIEMTKGKTRAVISIFCDIVMAVISFYAVKYSWTLALRSFNKVLAISKIPYFYCDIAFTIGYAHLFLVAVVDSIRQLFVITRKKGDVEG